MRERVYFDATAQGLALGRQALQQQAQQEAAFVMTLLGPARGRSVLDLPCGPGRHALRLARRGFQVLGLDASADCVREARRHAAHPRASYAQADVLQLDPTLRFDAVLSLFSCLGYLPDEVQNQRALAALAGAVRPAGLLILSTANRLAMADRRENGQVLDGPGHRALRVDLWNPAESTLHTHLQVMGLAGGKAQRFELRRRLYSVGELARALRGLGFGQAQFFADYQGSPLQARRSPHLICVARKAG